MGASAPDRSVWLITPIRLHVGGFNGTLAAGLRVEELVRFREELEGVYADVAGMAVLASLAGWLTLRVTCRSTGSLEVTGVACDQPGTGNTLEFAVAGMDQTYVPPLIEALRQCEQPYPVLGRPQFRDADTEPPTTAPPGQRGRPEANELCLRCHVGALRHVRRFGHLLQHGRVLLDRLN